MHRRNFERISSDIKIRFSCDNMDYCGTITNLSENGMFINTHDMCFPFDSKFEVVIEMNGNVMDVPVKVSRLTKTNESYDGIAVELLSPPESYLELIKNLRSDLTS